MSIWFWLFLVFLGIFKYTISIYVMFWDGYAKMGETLDWMEIIKNDIEETKRLEQKHNKLLLKEEKIPKYADVFKNLIIMELTSGTPIISYESDTFKESALASSFLAAMDTFVSKIGGSKMEEINYKGFYVQAAYGKFTKLACFLSTPADKSLKERLKHLIGLFEERYEEKIEKFKLTGDTNLFDTHEIIYLIKEIIDV